METDGEMVAGTIISLLSFNYTLHGENVKTQFKRN